MMGSNGRKLILSLFDHSGQWSAPYARNGYDVVRVDLQEGMDVLAVQPGDFPNGVHGILAAPPCTHFTGSGARWWADKDADGRTDEMLELIDHTLMLVRELQPKWWALENPVGRLPSLRPAELGKARLIFHPCDFGDAYTKRTCLWGDFNADLTRTPVEPVMYTDKNGKRGSWHWAKLGGKSERTKRLRSNTPEGFALAFMEANR